jgi:PIN domain nuclease of toxin-antitoxin system
VNYVLDASAMQALLRQEVGWQLVRNILADPGNTCFAHTVNLCEVFYDIHRAGGESSAQDAIADLGVAGVTPRGDMDAAFWQQAGRLKSSYRRVSLADCFAITLTQRVGGGLLTSDHHELDPLVPAALCAIHFIR